MKKILLAFSTLCLVAGANAQRVRSLDEISEDNSWLKVGVNAGVPVGDLSNRSGLALGAELTGQFMRTDNFGLGVTTGYTHYFNKKNTEYSNAKDIGAIPLGMTFRYYPRPSGVFVGTDAGYTFLTNEEAKDGGFYIRPQVGYHNYDWNVFGFYNQVFRKDYMMDLQRFGIGVTHNIRFK